MALVGNRTGKVINCVYGGRRETEIYRSCEYLL